MTFTGTPSGTPLDQAVDAAIHAVLNCYLRETDGWRVEAGPTAVVPLTRSNGELSVGIRYLSPTRRHLFDLPATVSFGGGCPRPAALTTVIALLLDELGAGGGSPTELFSRILDSTHDTARYLDLRAADIERLWGPAPLTFAESEQALLLGHLVHPTPKSRSEMSPADRMTYAPEAGARFRLHWFSVAADLVRHASATGMPAPDMAAALYARRFPRGRIVIPAHPWEAAFLRREPGLAELFESGAVVDLGPVGRNVAPTTSVRTVHHPAWPWQLKFSLHVRVTNSMRVTLPKELDRAVEAARLAATEVGDRTRAAAPHFRLIHDPAYLTACHPGFSVLFRDNAFTAAADVSALTTLCQDRPGGGPSRLGAIVAALAARHGRPPADVGREWFARFCDVVVRSLVRLYLDVGLCFEAHQQNTLVELDDGWPAVGLYRDSQGYFHREAAHDDLCRVIPQLGEATESIFPEALADERLVYYLFLNLTLGVVNALGAAGCADEAVLLADLRRLLEGERAAGGRYPATLLDRLLDDERWPCKANLATRLHDLDELVGDIATQSVYTTVPNPLVGL
jgi:spermidine-citrate ligase